VVVNRIRTVCCGFLLAALPWVAWTIPWWIWLQSVDFNCIHGHLVEVDVVAEGETIARLPFPAKVEATRAKAA
jgi:hypothetical protein